MYMRTREDPKNAPCSKGREAKHEERNYKKGGEKKGRMGGS
jgi:hypothetical protein